MTSPKSTLRRRRSGGSMAIPKHIAAWFAGERRISFTAAGPPHCCRLREYWAAWQAMHPDAVPPTNFEFLASGGERIARFLREGRGRED